MSGALDRIGKEDRGGGPAYQAFERTRMETIYTDTINKEKRTVVFSPFFNMNLVRPTVQCNRIKFSHNRMETTTEKIQLATPQERNSAESFLQDPSNEYEVNCIRHKDKGPPEKYSLPEVGSHDYGWLLSHPLHAKLLRESSAGNMTQPMMRRGVYTPIRRSASDPTVMQPMLSALNNKRWHCHGNQKSDVHAYAENYYTTMLANPFAKTQPLARSS
jgi:hypothetical protein